MFKPEDRKTVVVIGSAFIVLALLFAMALSAADVDKELDAPIIAMERGLKKYFKSAIFPLMAHLDPKKGLEVKKLAHHWTGRDL